jgi:glycosyltransferase involved in cell wall biosynthesis
MKVGLVIYGSIDIVSGGYIYDRILVDHLRSCGDQVEIMALPVSDYFSHLLGGISTRLPAGIDILIEDELVHPSVLLANRGRRAAISKTEPPVVSLVHNLRSSEKRPAWQNALYRQVEKCHLHSVDGYIFNSDATHHSAVALLRNQKPFVVAPPGGDRLGCISTAALLERTSRTGPLRLLFLANVTPLKGLHILLDALRRLPAGLCTLEVAGSLDVDRPYCTRMKAAAAACGSQVTFRGLLGDRRLIDLLLVSDVLVVPSYWEGFGIAYLEGMAYGLPALGTTAGSIPRLIAHGVNGFVIDPGDSAALAALLVELAADRSLLARMSANALEYFESSPTWRQTAETIRSFLMQMLA